MSKYPEHGYEEPQDTIDRLYNEIASLRERLEQAERERDNYNAMYEQALITATQSRKYGFRAGIEAAAREVPKTHILCDHMIRSISDIQQSIRALSPTDNTTTVADAAKVLLGNLHEYGGEGVVYQELDDHNNDPSDVMDALRALAAQKEDE